MRARRSPLPSACVAPWRPNPAARTTEPDPHRLRREAPGDGRSLQRGQRQHRGVLRAAEAVRRKAHRGGEARRIGEPHRGRAGAGRSMTKPEPKLTKSQEAEVKKVVKDLIGKLHNELLV